MRQDKNVSQRHGRASSTRPAPGPVTDPFVARWIRRALASDPPRARSLIVTVWGDALAPHGGIVWLAGLIRLMAPFGMNERLVRTSVFRLVRDGWLTAQSRGRRSRYRLTREGARRFDQAHHRIYTTPNPDWDGDWEVVLAPSDTAGAAARLKLRDELAWEGFGTLAPGAYARPLHGDSALPRIVSALRLESPITVLRAKDDPSLGGASLAARVATAWDLAELATDYRRFLARFGGVIDAFRAAGAESGDSGQCFIVRTLLIHAFRRVLLRDPQLPPALLPFDWPGAAAFALCRDFYRLTHKRAEMHLTATLSPDGDPLPPANPEFYRRFGGLD
jgi:phenylacetic acid degradation operon negative regulatory protein